LLQEKCCGAYNFSDYTEFPWSNTDDYLGTSFGQPASVPISCCERVSSITGENPASKGDFASFQQCLTSDGPEGKNTKVI